MVLLGASDSVVESHYRSPGTFSVDHGGVFAHVVVTSFDPDRVVHTATRDVIGVAA